MRITFEDTPRLAHVSEDGMRNQSILSHLEGTAVIAERFAKSFGGQEQARTAGLLHDIGKYSDGFQKRLKGGKKWITPLRGQRWLWPKNNQKWRLR